MDSRSQFIARLKREVGTKEVPSGSNKVKYNKIFYGRDVSGSAYPWCQTFAWVEEEEAGLSDQVTKTASCGAAANYAQKVGRWHWGASGIQAGDQVIFSFSSPHDHTGFCIGVGSSTITTIEGNTSLTSQDNGGNVMQRTRNKSKVYGYIRLTFAEEPDVPVQAPDKNILIGQQASVKFTGHKIACDGYDGPETRKQAVRVLQTALKKDYKAARYLKVDGVWGSDSNKKLGTHYVEYGERQYMVTAAEILLYLKGKDPKGVEYPGIFGTGLQKAAGKRKITADDFKSYLK